MLDSALDLIFQGKLAVVIDVLDQSRAFVDGPANITGVKRQSISFKNLSLTDIVIDIPRSVRQKALAKAFEKADVMGQWEKTAWAKKRYTLPSFPLSIIFLQFFLLTFLLPSFPHLLVPLALPALPPATSTALR